MRGKKKTTDKNEKVKDWIHKKMKNKDNNFHKCKKRGKKGRKKMSENISWSLKRIRQINNKEN